MSVTFKGKALIPSKYLEAVDLQGKSVPVTIAAIQRAELRSPTGKKETKPLFTLRGKEKGWILNKTNLALIAQVYGNKADNWIGKTVVIKGVEVEAFGAMKLAIRVDLDATREQSEKPAENRPSPLDPPPHNPETGEVAAADDEAHEVQ